MFPHPRFLPLVILLALSTAVAGDTRSEDGKMETIVVLTFNNRTLVVRMNDSPASRDFIAMLPLTLTFRDYNATEKISTLPSSLSLSGSPDGHQPAIGDLTYYAPWGNLAIFYKSFRYGNGLVPLGRIESGAESLSEIDGEFSMHISLGHESS